MNRGKRQGCPISAIIFRFVADILATNIMIKFKGIGSILFLKNGLKKKLKNKYKNHLRSNNYDVCTAVARCFPNILDVMVLRNVKLSEYKIGRPPLWSTETDSDFSYLHTL
jgi:hypothetical protein